MLKNAKEAYKKWKEWDNEELGQKAEMYYNKTKKEYGIIQHVDRNSYGFAGDDEFKIPVANFIYDIIYNDCERATDEKVIKRILEYVEVFSE